MNKQIKNWTSKSVGVKEAAQILGRGQTWVREHAGLLQGRSIPQRVLGKNLPGNTWRFDPTVLKYFTKAS